MVGNLTYPGWLKYVLLCNDWPIMSNDNNGIMQTACSERMHKYPKNRYEVRPNQPVPAVVTQE